MTQQNAALVEETASASEEMANQAQEFLAMVQKFAISKTADIDRGKTRVMSLTAAGAETVKKKDKGNGNGRLKSAAAVITKKESDNDLMKDYLKQEGFEEF